MMRFFLVCDLILSMPSQFDWKSCGFIIPPSPPFSQDFLVHLSFVLRTNNDYQKQIAWMFLEKLGGRDDNH